MPDTSSRLASATRVRQFRQSLLWPLRLLPVNGPPGTAKRQPWQWLAEPWRPVADEYTGDPRGFHERHYQEFVTFLPYVQRFLYGEGRQARSAGGRGTESPMRVFRRHDVAAVRVEPRPGDAAITLDVAHVDLYFFFDVDLVLLNVEVGGEDLALSQTQELLYRLGRGYPAGWDAQGRTLHAPTRVEWLDAQGQVLTQSDAQERERFLAHVYEHRSPRIAADWAFLLQPLVSDHSGEPGLLRFRQIEYYRMPLMAFLALDDPCSLSRSDFVRIGLVAGAADSEADAAQDPGGPPGRGASTNASTSAPISAAGSSLPFAEQHLADFEERFCYDRFWTETGPAPYTRYLCSGHSLVVVGQAGSEFFCCAERGVLSQFRHQHFLLFLIAHFQKAALLMFSDRLVEALQALDVGDPASVRRFKRAIRGSFEGFLRFTHRYWFHEVAEQVQTRALFKMCVVHLGVDGLYAEVKERIREMSDYLDADSLRRQANTVVRLTVVTIFGLIGTVTTGFLGMNLLSEADAPLGRRLAIFSIVFVVTSVMTVYTMVKSKRLSDFLDALSDERLSGWQKCKSLAAVWRRREE